MKGEKMREKWTPAPWRIGDNGTTIFGPPSDQPSPVVIAYKLRPTPRVSAEERKANFALQAAAPEMAEALRAFYDAACDVLAPMTTEEIKEHWQDETLDNCRKQARALLARLEAQS